MVIEIALVGVVAEVVAIAVVVEVVADVVFVDVVHLPHCWPLVHLLVFL